VVLLQGSEICGYVKNQQLGAENSNFLQWGRRENIEKVYSTALK
jgi:hypothetical protein